MKEIFQDKTSMLFSGTEYFKSFAKHDGFEENGGEIIRSIERERRRVGYSREWEEFL